MKKPFISLLAIFAISFASIALPTTTYAITSGDICTSNATHEAKTAAGCYGDSTKIEDVIINVINGVVGVFGIVATVFIIVGGVGYMTSNGDSGKVEKAKKTILYAVIGLIVSVLAFAIVNFVVANVINS